MKSRKKIENDVFNMVEKNDLEGVRDAIQKDPTLLKSTYGSNATLLHEACRNDHTEMVQLLLELGADVNACSNEGSPPLAYAIHKHAKVETIKALLDAKADLNYGGPYKGPLLWAYHNCSNDVVEELLKAGVRYRAGEVFASAVINGNEKLVDTLISYGVSVNIRDDNGRSLLALIAGLIHSDDRHYRIAKKLLELKADVNAKDAYGKTPLYYTVSSAFREKCLLDLATLFLDHGAKPHTPDYEGFTTFMYAAQTGKLPMIQLLIAREGLPDAGYYKTVLHSAASNRHEGVCQFFINKGLDCDTSDSKKMTPLHYACATYNDHNILALLKAGAKAYVKNYNNKTPLDLLNKSYDRGYYKIHIKALEELEVKERLEQLKQSEKKDQPTSLSKMECDVSEKQETHIDRCIILAKNGEKNIVKSLDTTIKLLKINFPETREAALQYIRCMNNDEFKLLKEHDEKNPTISVFISNVEKMLSQFPALKLTDVLSHAEDHYLYRDINQHITNMTRCCKKLKKLTGLAWKYTGVNMQSGSCYGWYPDEPNHPNKYANTVVGVLIARNILSGKNNGIQEPSIDWYKWNCQLVNKKALRLLNAESLKNEINEASSLLSKITGAPCHFLHLYPVENGMDYAVLEKIGCIKVEEYMAFNVQIIDFDLPKLRKLEKEHLSMEEIAERYRKADSSKPLFEQICKEEGGFESISSIMKLLLFKPADSATSKTHAEAKGYFRK